MVKAEVLSISVTTGKYSDFVDDIIQSAMQTNSSRYVCVANVHMLMEAQMDRSFAEIVSKANLITPDGMPLTWALRLLHGIKQERVSGMDLLPDLLREASINKVSVFIYGGSPVLLDRAAAYISNTYPDLTVAGLYSPPFRNLTEDELQSHVERINNSGARLLLVILGCPKQERWMASMQDRINMVMVGMGGALPVLVGMQKRAPYWMQRAGLEWLFRWFQEPVRLFKRYVVTNSMFLFFITWKYLSIKFLKRTL